MLYRLSWFIWIPPFLLLFWWYMKQERFRINFFMCVCVFVCVYDIHLREVLDSKMMRNFFLIICIFFLCVDRHSLHLKWDIVFKCHFKGHNDDLTKYFSFSLQFVQTLTPCLTLENVFYAICHHTGMYKSIDFL